MNDAQELEKLLQLLRDGDDNARRTAALKLGMMHNPVVIPDLLRAAGDSDKGVRSFVASALANSGEANLGRLRIALQSDDVLVRQTVIAALRHMKNPAVVTDIAPLLNDSDASVQHAAAEALRAYNTPEAQAALANWQN